MTYKLRYESLDDAAEEREFATAEEAITFAKAWFLVGYENETIDDHGREMARKDAERLVADLREGRDFLSKLFCEKISLSNERDE